VEVVAAIGVAETGTNWFDVLPSGRGAVIELDQGGIRTICTLDFESGEITPLDAGLFPRYANGYLLYGTPDGRTLLAAHFDARRLRLEGSPVTLAEGLLPPNYGWTFYSVSQTGLLLLGIGENIGARHEVVWVSRDGEVTTIDPDWTFDPGWNNRGLSLSPDGTHLVVTVLEEGNYDLWVKELPQGPETRFTFHGDQDLRPRFTPDGSAVTFISDRNSAPNFPDIYIKTLSGRRDPELLMSHEWQLWEGVLSPDGEWILGRTGGQRGVTGGRDVWAFRPGSDTIPFPLVVTNDDEKAISFSPDGRWLLYESDETGQNEVYIRSFPDVEADIQRVSTNGGVMPRWSNGGGEIFYVDADDWMVAASVDTRSGFQVTDRTPLFQLPDGLLFAQNEQYPLYDISPDDQRFIWFRRAGLVEVPQPDLIFFQNWVGAIEGEGGRR
jgi:hypothetical protein